MSTITLDLIRNSASLVDIIRSIKIIDMAVIECIIKEAVANSRKDVASFFVNKIMNDNELIEHCANCLEKYLTNLTTTKSFL